jgi:NADPH:quinone reductase
MKSVLLSKHGDPADVLSVAEWPVPEPGAGEVRVRIIATPVNPSDLLYVRGEYSGVDARFPAPVGFEGAGRVDALGAGVQGFTEGQRVVVLNSQGGNWAEYVVLPASQLLPAPDDLSDDQVASFMINPASAVMMVRHVLAVPPGEWLLQSAAGSEIGRMIIRLAQNDGIHTVNVVRRPEAAAELEGLGADAVIISGEQPIDEQVRRIVGPQGVKYAIDPVIGETGTQMYKALNAEGRMLLYGSLTGQPMLVGDDPRYILSGRRVVEVFWLGYWLATLGTEQRRRLVDEVTALMRKGILWTSPGRKFALDDIDAAIAQAESPGRQGKVLLVPAQPTGAGG